MTNRIIALAPMAGVTDRVFRPLCFENGCTLATTEMVSAQGYLTAPKSMNVYRFLLDRAPGEGDLRVQVFGCEPRFMAEAAYRLSELGCFTGIDINMGCPAHKVTASGGGSALLKSPMLCGEIVSAMCRATSLPVSVKIRLGWDENSINAVEVARICEQSGAQMITVHGRTKAQQYAGHADWQAIADVKQSVSIPVIANGDVVSGAAAMELLRVSGADGVAIGRAALGNPWIFAEVSASLSGHPYTPPHFSDVVDTALRHARDMAYWKGEYSAIIEMRKHFAWYLRGRRGAAHARTRLNAAQSLSEAADILHALEETPCEEHPDENI